MKKKMILSLTLITLSQGWAENLGQNGIGLLKPTTYSNSKRLQPHPDQGHGPIQTYPQKPKPLTIEQYLLLAYGQAIQEMVLNTLSIPNLSQNEVQQATLPTVIKNVITDAINDTTIKNDMKTLQNKSSSQKKKSQQAQQPMFNIYQEAMEKINSIIGKHIPPYKDALNSQERYNTLLNAYNKYFKNIFSNKSNSQKKLSSPNLTNNNQQADGTPGYIPTKGRMNL